MMYRVKLHHIGFAFEILMEAPSKAELLRRLNLQDAPSDTKIIHIKEQNAVLNPPAAG